jgi:hypothetical protein
MHGTRIDSEHVVNQLAQRSAGQPVRKSADLPGHHHLARRADERQDPAVRHHRFGGDLRGTRGQGGAADGTTGAAKLDRPGKPTMTDKPRIILAAKAWQPSPKRIGRSTTTRLCGYAVRGLLQGDADSSGTQIRIPLELILPDRALTIRVQR